MILSESLGWALEQYSASGIRVYCNKEEVEVIASSFMKEFSELWQQALEEVKEQYANVEDQDVPASIVYKEYGFFIEVSQLEIEYAYGDYYEVDYGSRAFNTAFTSMQKNYPSIKCDGYITYPLCDVKSGEMVAYELTRDVTTYDFVGEALNQLLNDDEVEESLGEQLEAYLDFEDTIKSLYAYQSYLDEEAFEKVIPIILDIAEENDEDVDGLNELIESYNEE